MRQAGAGPPLRDTKFSSPLSALRGLRAAFALAKSRGIPWQRVIDAFRPSIAATWHGWPQAERQRFLRHARGRWDVVRHRMAPRIAKRLDTLLDTGQLRVLAGRILSMTPAAPAFDVAVAVRGGGMLHLQAVRIVNCTGPRSDYATLDDPLFADLRSQGLIAPDRLRLGIETDDCAVVDAERRVSPWLFALGALTRPAWWEITAVPEINIQIGRLIGKLSRSPLADSAPQFLYEEFVDIGAGI